MHITLRGKLVSETVFAIAFCLDKDILGQGPRTTEKLTSIYFLDALLSKIPYAGYFCCTMYQVQSRLLGVPDRLEVYKLIGSFVLGLFQVFGDCHCWILAAFFRSIPSPSL